MIAQYPYYLFTTQVGNSVQDSNGNWSHPTSVPVLHSVCREETNGKGSVINGADGKAIVFSSTIYLPKSAARIIEGTEVLVSETNDPVGTVRIKGQVLKFDSGQLGNRLWV